MEDRTNEASSVLDRAPFTSKSMYETLQPKPHLNLVHGFIHKHAALTPMALAVRDGNQELSFSALDKRANQLARRLQILGVGPETPVGLYFERSVDFVVAALAVLKAGGAYVPLDSSSPVARIIAILQNANIPVLLSHRSLGTRFADWSGEILDLDVDALSIAGESSEAPAVLVEGNQLAYIIYTSGSTGRPKGVEVTHANLLHLVEWHQRAFSITPADRASQIAVLAFDAAVWEIWCHLAAGASLHLIDEDSRRSPESLKDWLVAHKITIAFVPTLFAEHLVNTDWPNSTALRILLTGADTLHRRPKPGLPFVLVNNYGPTECTVLVTSGVIDPRDIADQLPSIGRAIDHTQILILDPDFNRLPFGQEGEICVSGPQIARGYRNLPELTAEKFVSDPITGERLYRTGDRGRQLPDGQIAFLGRNDDQIKIRGFRIEPEEIVLHINSHPEVSSSAIVARRDSANEQSLVAYLILRCGSRITSTELRDYLRLRVPDYLIPSAFVSLALFPVNANGKCDKHALPVPAASNLLPESAEPETEAPKTQDGTQAEIIRIVSSLLGGKSIEQDANFFLVGGHSLMAAQLLARIRERFAVTLTLRQLFEAPTIAALSEAVNQKLTSNLSAEDVR